HQGGLGDRAFLRGHPGQAGRVERLLLELIEFGERVGGGHGSGRVAANARSFTPNLRPAWASSPSREQRRPVWKSASSPRSLSAAFVIRASVGKRGSRRPKVASCVSIHSSLLIPVSCSASRSGSTPMARPRT